MKIEMLGRELARAVRNGKMEQTDQGVLFPEAGLILSGAFSAWVNDGPKTISPNVVTLEGITLALNVLFKSSSVTAPAAWYIAPFSGTGTPAGSVTGANFTSGLTEFTAYNESARVTWPTVLTTTQTITQAAPSAFTINAASSNVYGAALLTTAAKSDTTGRCYAAAAFAAPKLAMAIGDVLYVTYSAAMTGP